MSAIAVSLIDYMGSDHAVSNAARVSFAKRTKSLMPSDERLIGFLARNGHFTPFAHPQITLHVKAPIYVARQCFKSKVGFVENEVSRRYVDGAAEFHQPVWRGRAVDKKQGSAGALLDQSDAEDIFEAATAFADRAYIKLLALGVAPEQARAILPLATMTEWLWTGSLAAWARFHGLRSADDAQCETREVADLAGGIIAGLFPVSWAALTGGERVAEVVSV